MKFLTDLENAMNETRTENGALTHLSTTDPVLDLFALGGATRKTPELAVDLFRKALAKDRVSAIRVLFYLRDVRGGQGERTVFRNCLRILADEYREEFEKIAPLVAEYGRWDDLVAMIDTKSAELVANIIDKQLEIDFKSDTPSLLAKWLPSENTSSLATRKLARKIRTELGATERKYRKVLSAIRAKIKIVEHNLTQKEYKTIDYTKLPSQASLKYTKAFTKHDRERYSKFLEKVVKGEAKINTKTLFTYQIYDALIRGDDVKSLDVMWNNLPDYTQGKNALVVADVSGSMSGQPISVSVSLALYFAERNKGQFKDYFITFSGKPLLQKVVGKNIREKMASIERSDWEMNTDVYKVFETIVDTAKKNRTPKEEMPSTIYIISDMEFDQAAGNPDKTNFEAINDLFQGTEYEVPNLVFWNVDAKSKQVPVTKNQYGVTLVSGMSTTTFQLAVEGKSPIDLMNEVIHSERYCTILA